MPGCGFLDCDSWLCLLLHFLISVSMQINNIKVGIHRKAKQEWFLELKIMWLLSNWCQRWFQQKSLSVYKLQNQKSLMKIKNIQIDRQLSETSQWSLISISQSGVLFFFFYCLYVDTDFSQNVSFYLCSVRLFHLPDILTIIRIYFLETERAK